MPQRLKNLEHLGVSTVGESKIALDYRGKNHFADLPTPRPSTFHDESSSSSSMPTNQMIMDELFSLRGYIAKRMDALDAKNQ
ncbi:hypothetical protein Lal_00042943 [Lupinus albus]|nr:hypothetical protein Lal_00042943 [Lupinus albus]